MAKTKTKGPSKSKSIRDFMRKNKGATVPQIVDGLKADGVVVTPGLVYQAKAAVKKKRGAKKVAKKMAGSSNGSTGTKADQIRDQAKSMPKPVRPRDVIAELKKKGVTASSAQVSTVLLAMGMKRRRKKAAGSASNSSSLNIDDLVAAKKLVSQVGSVEKVREALAALARLS
jgi:arginine repressor